MWTVLDRSDLREMAEILKSKYQSLPSRSKLQTVTEETIQSMIQSNGVVLLAFLAKWCAPCRIYEPSLERLSMRLGVIVAKVDVDEERNLVKEYEIKELPTTILIFNGKPVWREEGAVDEGRLEEVIRSIRTSGPQTSD